MSCMTFDAELYTCEVLCATSSQPDCSRGIAFERQSRNYFARHTSTEAGNGYVVARWHQAPHAERL